MSVPPFQKVTNHLRNFYSDPSPTDDSPLPSVSSPHPPPSEPPDYPELLTENPLFSDANGTPLNINPLIDKSYLHQTLKISEDCKDIFASQTFELRKARIMPAVIRLSDDIPVYDPPFNLSFIEREHLNEIIDGVPLRMLL